MIQTLRSRSSQTRIFIGKSIAIVGAAIIRGVPALGLPNTINLVLGMDSPTLSASPLWSITAKVLTPLAASSCESRSNRFVYRMTGSNRDDSILGFRTLF